MTKDEALRMALEALENHSGNYKLTKDECVKYRAVENAIKEALQSNEQVEQELTNLERHERNVQQLFGTPQPKEPEQEPVAGDMTAERAAYFVRRFKHEEKLLGPNEQAALDFVLAMLTTPPQPEQEPVAMKFKIYKPTVPDPTRQGINNALLPWVYDQDRSSGFDATMWVTPVATLPPQRTWVGLTDDDKKEYVAQDFGGNRLDAMDWAAQRLKEKNT